MPTLISLIFICILAIGFQSPSLADETQQFAFISESAYLQDKSEWQFSAVNIREENKNGRKTLAGTELALEYGISSNLQLGLNAFWHPELSDSLSNKTELEVTIGLSTTLVYETEYIPQISAGLSIGLEDKNSIEMTLAVSKRMFDNHFIHGNIERESDNDDKQTSLIIGYVFRFNDDVDVISEWSHTISNTKKQFTPTKNNLNIFSLGFSYKLTNDFDCGAGVQLYNSHSTTDKSIAVKLSYEF